MTGSRYSCAAFCWIGLRKIRVCPGGSQGKSGKGAIESSLELTFVIHLLVLHSLPVSMRSSLLSVFLRTQRFTWILLLLLAGPAAYAQAPAWQSVMAVGTGSDYSLVGATAADASGNVFVAGNFTGTIHIGPYTLGSRGSSDIFVGKWSPATSTFLWVQQAGGTQEDRVTAMAVNGTSVYISGTFSGSINFATSSLTSVGPSDVFVAKLTDNGPGTLFTWSQRAGGATDGDVSAFTMAVNGANIYVAGSCYGPGTFGTISSSGDDLFVAKLTDAGPTASFVWVQRTGGNTGQTEGAAVAVSGSNVFVLANLGGNATFGTTTITSAGGEDVVVAKIIDAGTTSSVGWAQRCGGTGNDYSYSLAASGANVYVAGNFLRTADFGSTTLTSAGGYDMFISKLADAGASASFVWTQQAGGPGSEHMEAMTTSGADLYVTGDFYSTPATFGATALLSEGYGDVFVAKLSDAGATGSFSWAQRAGGVNRDYGGCLAVTQSSLYIGGAVNTPATFGAYTLPGSALGDMGFLASLPLNAVSAAHAPAQLAGLRVYPNPARAVATVVLPPVAGFIPGQAAITLMDPLGRVVRTWAAPMTAAGGRQQLDLAGLTRGIYTLKVQAGSTLTMRHLAVE
jgi:hypothetical protein